MGEVTNKVNDEAGEELAPTEPPLADAARPVVPATTDTDSADQSLAALCPNCGTPIDGPFCSSCGQSQKNLNKQVWTLAGEVLDDVFRLDSRVVRTLIAMICKPGFLTTEYFAGRRARYSPPVRLYLVISFLFFVITPALNDIYLHTGADRNVVSINADEAEKDKLDSSFSELELGWLSAEENRALQVRLETQLKKTIARAEENPQELWRDVMDLMSAVMFFMLPVFAVFLKFFYIGSGVYYAEHLLLALHNHCFLFTATLISGSLDLLENTSVGMVTGFASSGIMFWIPVYMYLSLKHTFKQSHTITCLKFTGLTLIYMIIASLGILTAVMVEVLRQ